MAEKSIFGGGWCFLAKIWNFGPFDFFVKAYIHTDILVPRSLKSVNKSVFYDFFFEIG